MRNGKEKSKTLRPLRLCGKNSTEKKKPSKAQPREVLVLCQKAQDRTKPMNRDHYEDLFPYKLFCYGFPVTCYLGQI